MDAPLCAPSQMDTPVAYSILSCLVTNMGISLWFAAVPGSLKFLSRDMEPNLVLDARPPRSAPRSACSTTPPVLIHDSLSAPAHKPRLIGSDGAWAVLLKEAL